MPAIHLADTPLSSRSTHPPADWTLIWILVAVAALLLVEAILAIGYIFFHHIRSTNRWRQMREKGVVVVNGPALIWVDDVPIRRQVSRFDLRQVAEASRRNLRAEPGYLWEGVARDSRDL